MEQYQKLGMQLKLKRVEAGLFQRTMAAMLGISQPHLSWWETGKYKPSAGNLTGGSIRTCWKARG